MAYAFEIIATFKTEGLKDKAIAKIESMNLNFEHKIEQLEAKRIRFNGTVETLVKAKQIRNYIKNYLNTVDKKNVFAQIWYAKIGYEEKEVEKEKFDEDGNIVKYMRKINVPKMENNKEIEVGELGVTKVS